VPNLLSRCKVGVVALLRNQTGTEAATAAREIDQAEREAIVIGEDEQRSLAIPLGQIPAVYADICQAVGPSAARRARQALA
jgi:hypothetical protein